MIEICKHCKRKIGISYLSSPEAFEWCNGIIGDSHCISASLGYERGIKACLEIVKNNTNLSAVEKEIADMLNEED